MKYKEALTYLETLKPNNFRMELTPLEYACKALKSPQAKLASVHISGTNGKGSTAAFCEALLRGSGYRVGLYTSPHLIDVRERIQIDRSMIGEDSFVSLIERIRDDVGIEKPLSYFEVLTLMSFLYFKENKVDIAVYETGLGGRLDATNLITPKVVIITPISFDHTKHLGNDLVSIAKEKCGIIKREVITITAMQEDDVMDVIAKTCDDMGSPLIVADSAIIGDKLGLTGEHQRQNAACALEAVKNLEGFNLANIANSLAMTEWSGRLQKLNDEPNVIIDGAHNPGGAKALAKYLSANCPKERTVVMLGIMKDKDTKEIIRHIAPHAREVICVAPDAERSSSPKDLAAIARSYGIVVHQENQIAPALKKWLSRLAKEDTLIVTGSLYTVGETLQYFKK